MNKIPVIKPETYDVVVHDYFETTGNKDVFKKERVSKIIEKIKEENSLLLSMALFSDISQKVPELRSIILTNIAFVYSLLETQIEIDSMKKIVGEENDGN